MKTFKDPHFFFTVDVEEWFASKLIKTSQKEKEARSDVDDAMHFLLDLLKAKNIKGTFFYLWHTAQKYPDVVRRTIQEGHEIGLHGDKHDNILDLGEKQFVKMLRKTKKLFKEKFGVNLKGYRAPHFGSNERLTGVLKEQGFLYDSSTVPCLPIPGWYGSLCAKVTPHRDKRSELLEFPVSVHPTFRIPGGGGYYFRNLGRRWTQHVLHAGLKRNHYAMFYLHPWELALKNPRKRPGVPFYTFCRTGKWARKNLEVVLDKVLSFPGVQCKPIKDILNL